jgi:putative transposase
LLFFLVIDIVNQLLPINLLIHLSVHMSHSNVKQFIHVMWSTENQNYLIQPPIHNYLCGYMKLAIRTKIGVEYGGLITASVSLDHAHILLSLPQHVSLSSLMNHVKNRSSKWLKTQENIDPSFKWQSGFIAFGVQEDKINRVKTYINNDETRRLTMSYPDEALAIIKKQNMEFNEKYYLQGSVSKILLHVIWSTNHRMPLLNKDIQQELYNFTRDIVLQSKGKVYEIGGIEDHIHILVEVPRDQSLADFIKNIKTKTTYWLKLKDQIKFRDFEWQTGFGAFTISYSSMTHVSRYIQGQEEHHRKTTFQEELKNLILHYKDYKINSNIQ